jgi:hypothetical protein
MNGRPHSSSEDDEEERHSPFERFNTPETDDLGRSVSPEPLPAMHERPASIHTDPGCIRSASTDSLDTATMEAGLDSPA